MVTDLGAAHGGRRKRQTNPLLTALVLLGALGVIALLWYWVFAPLFIPPQEFFARQKRFDRAIRDVIAYRSTDPADLLPAWPEPLTTARVEVLLCAERALTLGVRHAPQERDLPYPFGDLPAHLGTSTDLIIRCLREVGLDLQQLIHHDRRLEPRRYPPIPANKKLDRGRDHRRVANVFTFARAFAPERPIETATPAAATAFQPGDLVFWAHSGREGLPGLAGVVSDRRDETGMPLVVTLVPDEERISHHHRVDEWPILGHVALDPEATMARFVEMWPSVRLEDPPPRPAPP